MQKKIKNKTFEDYYGAQIRKSEYCYYLLVIPIFIRVIDRIHTPRLYDIIHCLVWHDERGTKTTYLSETTRPILMNFISYIC